MNNLLAQFDPAAIQVPTTGGSWFNVNTGTLGELISALLNNIVFFAAGIALLIYLVTGGLQMMLSRGDPKAIQAAQGKITNALIGFVIIVVAFLVVQLLAQLFGSTGTGGFGEIFGT